MRVAAAILLCAGLPAAAQAACELDAFGDITNPSDPSCRDARFTYTRDVDDDTHIALGYDVPVPVDSLTPVDGFRSYDALHARHQALAAEGAARGEVVGETLAGRAIWAYVVGDADDRTVDGRPEPAVLVNGTIHPREWASPEAATAFYEWLAEHRDDDGLGRWLHENLSTVIVPVHNVDGFLTTQAFPDGVAALRIQPREGRMRRKNLRHPSQGDVPIDAELATSEDNFQGVDLNRNGPQRFGENGGSSPNPVSLVYRGAAASSEPESQALQAAAALVPGRLRLYTDLHSFSQVYLAPMTGNARRDAITVGLAARMRAASGNRYRFLGDTPGSGIGTTADWAAYTFQVPSWTLELEPIQSGAEYGGTGVSHSGFVLPESEATRMREEVADMLTVGALRQAGPPRVAALQIRTADDDTPVYDARWEADGNARRRVVTTRSGLEPGRAYRLWLAFDRPMRAAGPAGGVANLPGQNVAPGVRLVLQAPSLDAGSDLVLQTGAAAWRSDPGGAPLGYARYRHDALAVEFTAPAAWGTGAPLPLVLTVAARDAVGHALDGDPATPADWGNGHWTGYEDAEGTAADAGGVDCSFAPYAGDGAAPAELDCREAATAPPPPPPPPGDSGGGGAAGLGLVLLAWMAARRRRR